MPRLMDNDLQEQRHVHGNDQHQDRQDLLPAQRSCRFRFVQEFHKQHTAYRADQHKAYRDQDLPYISFLRFFLILHASFPFAVNCSNIALSGQVYHTSPGI